MSSTAADLHSRPFTRAEAQARGITSRMLQGKGYIQLFPRVWRRRELVMTRAAWVQAAAMALPDRAHLTGISRLQALGLDYGPGHPVHFVIEGELHLAFNGVFLHRTKRLPPLDEIGVSVEGAYLAYCRRARVIDAIKVGDWLRRHHHLDPHRLEALAVAELWRDGANETLWVAEHLDANARSLMESELRALLTFAGLPRPECNPPLNLSSSVCVTPDLLYRELGLVIEYEGEHHQSDRDQYVADLDR